MNFLGTSQSPGLNNAAPTTPTAVGPTIVSSENAYLGLKVGFDIGGGRR